MNQAGPTGMLAASQHRVHRAISGAENAWATWRGASQTAHLAAVMGHSLPCQCTPDRSADDTNFQEPRASTVVPDHADALQAAVGDGGFGHSTCAKSEWPLPLQV